MAIHVIMLLIFCGHFLLQLQFAPPIACNPLFLLQRPQSTLCTSAISGRAASYTWFLSSFVCHERLALTQGMKIGGQKCSLQTIRAVDYMLRNVIISLPTIVSLFQCLFWSFVKDEIQCFNRQGTGKRYYSSEREEGVSVNPSFIYVLKNLSYFTQFNCILVFYFSLPKKLILSWLNIVNRISMCVKPISLLYFAVYFTCQFLHSVISANFNWSLLYEFL